MASSTRQCRPAVSSAVQLGRSQPLRFLRLVSAAPEPAAPGDPTVTHPYVFIAIIFQILKLPNISSPIIHLEAPSEMKLPENLCSQNQDPLN